MDKIFYQNKNEIPLIKLKIKKINILKNNFYIDKYCNKLNTVEYLVLLQNQKKRS